jgi:hypothetical protein
MSKLKKLAPLAIVLSALVLAACQTGKSSTHGGDNARPYYGWDAKHGGGGP